MMHCRHHHVLIMQFRPQTSTFWEIPVPYRLQQNVESYWNNPLKHLFPGNKTEKRLMLHKYIPSSVVIALTLFLKSKYFSFGSSFEEYSHFALLFSFFMVVCSPRLQQLVLFCVCKIIIVARPSLVTCI